MTNTFICHYFNTICSQAIAAHRPIWKASTTQTQDKINTLKSWMKTCSSEHGECQPTTKHLPKRLIDVGTSAGRQPRLVLSENLDDQAITYTTLSYCWGNSRFGTTKSTESLYRKAIPWEVIPLTLQDALTVTRSLQISYVWIDCLCIVQDDHQEWRTEASRMQDIYAGGSLTIAATDASDSSMGFLPRETARLDGNSDNSLDTAEQEHKSFFSVTNSEDSTVLLVRMNSRDIRAAAQDSVLNTRGWVLQEMVLSHRTVHFMCSELYWQCRCEGRTESGLVFDETSSGLGSLPVHSPSIQCPPNTIWWKWMESYSRRHFSFPNDRLPALAGIVQHYERIVGHLPILGMWRQSIHQDLLWMRSGDLLHKAHKLSNIPSWSWLSCPAPIRYDPWNEHEARRDVEDHITLVDCEVVWTSEPFTSDVKSSWLIIEGPVKEITLGMAPLATDFDPPYLDVDDEEQDFAKHPIPWRCAGQSDQGMLSRSQYLCLLLRSWTYKDRDVIRETFLILEPCLATTGRRNAYRRVGLGNIRGERRTFALEARQSVNLV
jgi:hypothetical protein